MTTVKLINSRQIHQIILWGLFFLICLTLGYSTLNRYDPRVIGNIDSKEYYELVTGSPQDAVGHWRYRVLVPYLAKPFYWLAQGRIGTWDPVFFGLLIVNAALCATSAYLIVLLGSRILENSVIALLGALLYLLSFAIINGHLAGLIDAGEGCLMLALAWAMFRKQWWLLPLLGLLGGLAKETFIPLAGVFALAWWLVDVRRNTIRTRQILWIIGMGVVGLATIMAVRSLVSGYVIWPWDILSEERLHTNLLSGFLACILGQGFWYIFIWLLPLGIWRLGSLPLNWVSASTTAFVGAWFMGAWNNAGGNAARAMFNAAGPILSLSTAIFIVTICHACLSPGPQEKPEAQQGILSL